jgi:hydroxypyruvate isomerase
MGIGAIDLIAPKDWPMLKKYGLYSSMCYIAGKVSLTEGWNNKTFHPQLIKRF